MNEAKILKGPYSEVGISLVLSVVLYVCKTWSVPIGEERRLEVFEKGVLRGIFGIKRQKVT
jgi:uncharacterized membrane protein YraQ (UPF0718 family)